MPWKLAEVQDDRFEVFGFCRLVLLDERSHEGALARPGVARHDQDGGAVERSCQRRSRVVAWEVDVVRAADEPNTVTSFAVDAA